MAAAMKNFLLFSIMIFFIINVFYSQMKKRSLNFNNTKTHNNFFQSRTISLFARWV